MSQCNKSWCLVWLLPECSNPQLVWPTDNMPGELRLIDLGVIQKDRRKCPGLGQEQVVHNHIVPESWRIGGGAHMSVGGEGLCCVDGHCKGAKSHVLGST